MRKLMIGIFALFTFVAFTACSDKKGSKDEEETEESANYNSKEYRENLSKRLNDISTAEDFIKLQKDYMKCEIAFLESNPSESEVAEFEEWDRLFGKKATKISEKYADAFEEASEKWDNDPEAKKLEEKLKKALQAYWEKQSKDEEVDLEPARYEPDSLAAYEEADYQTYDSLAKW